MVRLDRGRRAVDRARLDHVRVDRTLRQPANVLDLDRLLVEHLHEVAADDLALALGVGDAGQVAQELGTGLHALDVQTHVLVRLQHVFELVLAQQSRIDEDAVEVLADGLVQQHGGHRRIDTARKSEHDLVVAHLLAQLAHGGLHETLRGPRLRAAADAHDEVLQQLRAVGRVVDLRVELDTPSLLARDAERGDAHILGAGDQFIVVGHARDGVAVRHPHLRSGRQVAHQRIRRIADGEHRTAVFAAGRGLHLAAEGRSEELGSVADAQQRQFALEGRKVGVRGLGVPHGIGAARKNHTPHRRIERRNFVEGVDFAIDVQFADTACDQLRVLRPEVENEDFFHLYRVYCFLTGRLKLPASRISAAKASQPTSRMRSTHPLRSERKTNPKIRAMKLLNFPQLSSGISVHSAQLCQPCPIQQARTLHQEARSLGWHPGQEPFANLRQVPQKSPQAAISGFIISVRSSSWAPRS